ncbi:MULTISPECIES: hypothetical protein [Streptomyces]|uniref:Uncharacterized protein n=1 Tax=Streptomyces solicathayae TaxID=3081768 RepID=A0ABZ0LWZ0_9ACTN|nr:hypothetical protein [Streptomyces sp. HUAS YS2]WOX24022.1 hypothetical protein R2D22_22590 [Streptomyces sp. HUAS YS2]
MTNGRSELDVVAAALAALPPVGYGWTDEMQDLYERFLRDPEVELPQEYRQKFESQRERQRLSSSAHEAWWSLEKHLEAGDLDSAGQAEAADLAERCVRSRFVAHEAVSLLHTLGRPVGEEALLRLVRDPSVDEYDRAWAREWLIKLRREDNRARAREAVEGEEPLLPGVVRDLPVSPHGGGVEWPDDPDLLRRVLEALLPAGRLVPQEPPADWHHDDEGEEVDYSERPEWFDIGLVARDLMPHPTQVTHERTAELRSECELLGLDVSAADFVERQVTRIRAETAAGAFHHLGFLGHRRPDEVTPWAMDLARRYVECDAAAEEALYMLTYMNELPYGREVLARLAADASLRPEIRARAEGALR